MIRLKRLDVLLVLGFIATTVAGIALHEPEPKLPKMKPAVEGVKKERPKKQLFPKIDDKQMQEKLEKDPKLARRVALSSAGFAAVGAGSLLCALLMALRLWRGQPPVTPTGSPPFPTWGLREVVRLILLILVIGQAALIIEWLLFKASQPAWLDHTILSLFNTVLMDLVAAIYAVSLLKKVDKFRQQAGQMWPSVKLALTCYLVFLPFFFMLTSLVYSAMQAIQIEPVPQTAVTMFLSEKRTSVIWWLTILATVGGPVAEEFFFRGILYGWLRQRLGIGAGLILTSLLFSALHANLVAFLPVLGLGLLFGWVYEKTGTLWAPIAIHVLHNTGMIAIASLIKELIK